MLGSIYGWVSPNCLAPHRHEQLSSWYFLGTYALTLIGAVIFTLGRSPKRYDFAGVVLVLMAWVYLYFFVMINSFGS
jgi:hypothetical protein